MKRALIIYAVFFVLTIIIPALVCFVQKSQGTNSELVNIFNVSLMNLIEYYH